MPNWEYFVLTQTWVDTGLRYNLQEFNGLTDTDALNKMGSFGWELVQVEHITNTTVTDFYFKRPTKGGS